MPPPKKKRFHRLRSLLLFQKCSKARLRPGGHTFAEIEKFDNAALSEGLIIKCLYLARGNLYCSVVSHFSNNRPKYRLFLDFASINKLFFVDNVNCKTIRRYVDILTRIFSFRLSIIFVDFSIIDNFRGFFGCRFICT